MSQANIVRGSVYGLIGNSYIVTRAGSIVNTIKRKKSTGKALSKLLEEGEALARSYEEWQNAVQAREIDIEFETETPPRGKIFVDPADGETEI